MNATHYGVLFHGKRKEGEHCDDGRPVLCECNHMWTVQMLTNCRVDEHLEREQESEGRSLGECALQRCDEGEHELECIGLREIKRTERCSKNDQCVNACKIDLPRCQLVDFVVRWVPNDDVADVTFSKHHIICIN